MCSPAPVRRALAGVAVRLVNGVQRRVHLSWQYDFDLTVIRLVSFEILNEQAGQARVVCRHRSTDLLPSTNILFPPASLWRSTYSSSFDGQIFFWIYFRMRQQKIYFLSRHVLVLFRRTAVPLFVPQSRHSSWQIRRAPGTDGLGVVATPVAECWTGDGLGWSYFNWPHCAATAWTGLAILASTRRAGNPNPFSELERTPGCFSSS